MSIHELQCKELLKQGKHVDAVIGMISQNQGVTFVEIENLLDHYLEIGGHMAFYNNEYPNLILWMNMSQEFIDVMIQVMKSGKIKYDATSPLTYMADGKCPSMPIAKSVRHYKEPHWIPVAFYSNDTPEKEEKGE